MSNAPGGGHRNDLSDLAFDPSGSNMPPPLRPPLLNQAQLQAALQLGFSDKCIPSGGVGNGRGDPYYQPPSEYGSQFSPGRGEGSDYYQGSQYPPGDRVDGRGHYTRETEQEGLMDPLRRPDVNQIPPDVLAVLIKTGRIQEILGQDQRQQSQPHSAHSISDPQMNPAHSDSRMSARNVTGNQNHNNRDSPPAPQQQQAQGNERSYSANPHQQQPRTQDYRYASAPSHQHQQTQERSYSATSPRQQTQVQDRNYSPPQRNPNHNGSSFSSPGSSQQRFRPPPSHLNERKMIFSPDAKEFRPSGPPPANIMNFQQEADLAQALAQFQMMNQSSSIECNQNPYSSQPVNDIDNMDLILSTVADAISDLTLHPANFNRCAKTMTEVLKNYLNDNDTLGVVVTLLVEQSISNPNFCYSGARLSQALIKNGVAVGTATFKNFLLARCQDEFKLCLANIDKDPAFQIRSRGLLMFFGELFVNIRIETATAGVTTPLAVLGLGVIELMQKIVKEPSHENVKSVFQVLKLVGWDLDNSTAPKVKPEFEKLVKDLSYLNQRSQTIKPQTKLLLESLFTLMNKNWNREESTEETESTPTPVSSPPSSNSGQSQVYEMPESDEEDYDESGLMLDDEPSEVQNAYEEFLKMGKRK